MFSVTLPLATGLLVSAGLLWTLWKRGGGRVPWFEIGLVYAAIVTLYLVYPLVGFVVLHGTYTNLNDARLSAMPPTAAEVASIGWMYAAHLAGFVAMYLSIRGRLPRVRPRPDPPGFYTILAAVVAYVLVVAVELAAGVAYDTSAASYIESYLVLQRLPLFVAQLLNHLAGMKYPLSLTMLTLLFAHYRRARPIVALWLLAALLLSATRLGNRTDVVLLLFAAAAMYHALVRPIPARLVIPGILLGLGGFVAFGAIRGGTTGLNPFAASTEFEGLFANAVHLHRVSASLTPCPPALYVADVAALVPQQLLPFTKIDPATWYVTQYFPVYASMGGGLAFGTIAEAVLTGGWMSALIRGAALGLCFACVHRAYVRHGHRLWMFVFYVWMTTLAYQCFRNTTFSLGVLFVYRFVPAAVLLTLLGAMLAAIAGVRPVAARSAPREGVI